MLFTYEMDDFIHLIALRLLYLLMDIGICYLVECCY